MRPNEPLTANPTARRPFVAALIVLATVAVGLAGRVPTAAVAHPLGNFTINQYSRIELYSDLVRVHYVLDMAEIPTFQARGDIDVDGDGQVSGDEAESYAASAGDEVAGNLRLALDGGEANLGVVSRQIAFPQGQGGLETLRLDMVLETAAPPRLTAVEYDDANYSDRSGWKEIVVVPAAGVRALGEFPSQDASQALTVYPDDLLSSPLDVRSVAFSFDSTAGALAPPFDATTTVAAAPERSGGGLASLIDMNNPTLAVVLLALAAAFGFGAIHALEPGHGKSMVAAYFVGVKGTARQAMALGLIVAVTHSLGVFALGLVTLFASEWILPERLYPWLTLASGLLVFALGLRLVASRGGFRWLHRFAHRLPWGHHHAHEAAVQADGTPPWRSLVALGLADGLTPSPSALVVLLGAVSIGRLELGVGLIVAFSTGLAAVLAAISLALVYARTLSQWLTARPGRARGLTAGFGRLVSPQSAAMRIAPTAGALALVAVGAVITLRALSQPGLAPFF